MLADVHYQIRTEIGFEGAALGLALEHSHPLVLLVWLRYHALTK